MSTPDFIALVKDGLEHLYDPACLREHPLTRVLLPERLRPGVKSTQALRQVLLDAIDSLRRDTSPPSGAPWSRDHQILQLRYVEALPFREVMARLGLGQAQYFRNLRHAHQTIATLLWESVPAEARSAATTRAEAPGRRPPYAEVDAATHHGESLTDLNDTTRAVVELLRDVVANHDVVVCTQVPAQPLVVPGNRTALRQFVITAVGYVLGGARGGQIVISTMERPEHVIFSLTYEGALSDVGLQTNQAIERLALLRQLIESLHGALSVEKRTDGLAITAEIPVQRRTLLVIDDSPDMVQLVSRLIADQNYTVLSATTVSDGLAIARSAHPDVILVDIMLPGQDGWDAIQALKHDPSTQEIPILVCTVLGESDLALALGAAEFIRKPLTRDGLLAALARWADPLARRVGEH
ncbi:MAG: response regulator [Chloroflexi bacterium]|nr:response regulator [Chloroflexota bacterium]